MSEATSVPSPLPEDLLDLLRRPTPCYVSTLDPDGTPRARSVWADTDGRHSLVRAREAARASRNAARDERVAVVLGDPGDPGSVLRVRGRVRDITADGAAERHEALARRYDAAGAGALDAPTMDDRGGREVLLVIEAQRIRRAT